MSRFSINFLKDNNVYFPEEIIEGTVSWQLNIDPKKVYLRLFWFTSGKGTEDMEVVDEISFDNPGISDSRPFKFTLPNEPYSFSGKLVSLTWALEILSKPGKEAEQKEIVVSPYGHEVNLTKSGG